MIEPLITEKQCKRCMEFKPLTSFSRCANGAHGYHSYCKKCRSSYTARVNKLTRRSKRPDREEIWPRPMREQILDRELVSWPAPIASGPLVPALGMPVAGMREAA